MTDLVSRRSKAPESLTIASYHFGMFIVAPAIIRHLTAVDERKRAAFALHSTSQRPWSSNMSGVGFRRVASVDQHGYRNHQAQRLSAGHRQITAYRSELSRMGGS